MKAVALFIALAALGFAVLWAGMQVNYLPLMFAGISILWSSQLAPWFVS